MTLDIEHFRKVSLLREAEKRDEHGYAIVADYMASLSVANREHRLRELKTSGRSPYSSGIYSKYAGDMPVWAFLELTSFGTLIDFVRFCANRWGDRRLKAFHYDLKGVKCARNAAAHGSRIVNAFVERDSGKSTITKSVVQAVCATGASKETRSKWMACAAMQQIATVLVAYTRIVPRGSTRVRAEKELSALLARIDEAADILPANGPDSTALAALRLISSLTTGLGLLK